MAISVLFASLDPALDVELENYNKDGGVHPSNKFNPKPRTVDAAHYHTRSSFATDLEAGTARLEARQERNAKGGVQTLLSRFIAFLSRNARRFGRLTCPGCAFNSAE